MHLLSGIGGCCASTDKVESVARRDSSISLEDGAYKRHTPEPVKSPLSFDLGIFDKPRESLEHEPTLPAPSPTSSPSVTAPMDVYLRCDDSHESRMMRFSGTVPRQDKNTELGDISPAESSWEFILPRYMPSTPVLQPALSPKPTDIPSNNTSNQRGRKNTSSGSDMSDLALSVDSHLSEDEEAYKEAIAEYRLTSKRYRHASPRTSKRPRVYKDLPRRRGAKRDADDR